VTRVRIAHLSDPHFGTVQDGVRSALLAVVRGLAPDLVLISGDITQRARRAQFRAARDFLTALRPVPAVAIPGNHDIPLFNVVARLLRPYGGFHRYLQEFREVKVDLGGVRVIGLNSTSKWRHVQGRLDLDRIRPLLRGNTPSGQVGPVGVRIVAVHHPLDCAKRVDDKNLIVDREAVFRELEAAEVDLVVSGHVHDPFVTLSADRYQDWRRSMILSVAGTCLSWRTRKGAPNSFHLIDVDPDGPMPRIVLSRYDFDGAARFAPRTDAVARFERRGATGWTRI
jgi:3',5'-cyclic AMP phosphodiesterase CpdA